MSVEDHPVQIAVVDDYDVVVAGVANMLEPYRDRVVVAELDTRRPIKDEVDIALYDSFAQPESDQQEIKVLVDNPRARRVVVYTWNFHPDLVSKARDLGVSGYLSKALTARELVGALEAVHAGEVVVSDVAHAGTHVRQPGLARPAGGPHRSRGGDPGADHAGQEQRRDRRADLPQPQHHQVLHPHALPQDRRREPDPGRAVGCGQRVPARPPPHRALARRPLGRRVDLLAALGRGLGAVRVGGGADVVSAS